MGFPIEYRDRMLAEQMVMMDALQFIAQFIIYFALLVAFVILIVEISGIFRIRQSERRSFEQRQPHPPEMATNDTFAESGISRHV
jgi:flagellar biosynthesis/type III secretory pathway M-ring protein FliF/YscJ